MSLFVKFNLILGLVFAVALVPAGLLSYRLLQANARAQVLENAGIMMQTALATRTYTNKQIKPLLAARLAEEFLPQTVPAYSATEVFNYIRESHPEYTYKEATLNPTNPRDRAVEWESDIINQFRANPERGEIMGERDTPTGRTLYVARPFQIKDPACLVCHSTVEAAPKTMVDRYGPANGFGWQLNEVIGAQVVVVPTAIPIERANAAFKTFMTSLTAVFVVIGVALNLMLLAMVIRPVTRLSKLADEVSLGNMDVPDFQVRAKDEIGTLADSFNRMKKSLVQAMKMLEE